ncbi:hypothetical protein T03_307 [Trichinella britovi]|uniref:Uncharacterized protein n=1 Tax=Trichinella britovi TaxID=45882 RepID=A0A0V1CC09_TRIBR|nr:hypothetical protein T03_307 [Trichinella britovi]
MIGALTHRRLWLQYETLLATSITELVLLDSFELKHSFLPSAHLEASPSEYSTGFLTLKKCQKIEKMLITSSYQCAMFRAQQNLKSGTTNASKISKSDSSP